MDNDITETDYKGEKKNTISPLYNWHLDLHFQINYHINLIIAFVHKRVTSSGVLLLYVRHVQLCATPKGMDFAPFLV